MKFIFYVFLFSQLLNFLGVFAEKLKESSSVINPVNWEKVEENKSKPLKKIIWKSYKGDGNYFKNENKKSFSINQFSETKSDMLEPQFGAIESCILPLRKLICQMLANSWVCTVSGLTIDSTLGFTAG